MLEIGHALAVGKLRLPRRVVIVPGLNWVIVVGKTAKILIDSLCIIHGIFLAWRWRRYLEHHILVINVLCSANAFVIVFRLPY